MCMARSIHTGAAAVIRHGSRLASKATPENHAWVLHLPAEPLLMIRRCMFLQSLPCQVLCGPLVNKARALELLHSGSALHGSAAAALAPWVCTSGNLGSAQHIQLSSGTAMLLSITLLGILASLTAC